MFLNKDGITVSVPETDVQQYLSKGFKEVKNPIKPKTVDNPVLKMTKNELIAYAAEHEYAVDKSLIKEKILAAIIAAEEKAAKKPEDSE